MSSRGIDFSKLQPEPEEPKGPTRHIIMTEAAGADFKNLAAQYPFYGVLLPDPNASRINEYIRTHWDQLDKMSGVTCLLLSPLPPAQPTEEIRALLEQVVGPEKAAQAWEKYQAHPEQTINDVYTHAAGLDIGLNRLPCLVLMTDLASDRKLIQRLPNWEADDLTRFFTELFTRMNGHRHAPDSQARLDALQGDLGMRFMLGLQAGRAARGIHDTLAEVQWSEVIKSALTNETFLNGAFKALFGAFGIAVG
jgi:hypothetical protein